MLIEKDFAYVLQVRSYRENSAIATLLTQQNGRLNLIVKNIKSKQHHRKASLQPCQRLIISYQLRDNLSLLTSLETDSEQTIPEIKYFMLISYINELIIKCLPERLPLDELFYHYQRSLILLCQNHDQLALRAIEMTLIQHFLSIPELDKTQDDQIAIVAEKNYYFDAHSGVYSNPQTSKLIKLKGTNLIAFSDLMLHDVKNIDNVRLAKPLITYFIRLLLNGKELKTIAVYKDLQKYI